MVSPFENQWNQQPAPKSVDQLKAEQKKTWNPLKLMSLAGQIRDAQERDSLLAEAEKFKLITPTPSAPEPIPAKSPAPDFAPKEAKIPESFLDIDLVGKTQDELRSIQATAEQYRETAKTYGEEAALDAIINEINGLLGIKAPKPLTPLGTFKQRLNLAPKKEPGAESATDEELPITAPMKVPTASVAPEPKVPTEIQPGKETLFEKKLKSVRPFSGPKKTEEEPPKADEGNAPIHAQAVTLIGSRKGWEGKEEEEKTDLVRLEGYLGTSLEGLNVGELENLEKDLLPYEYKPLTPELQEQRKDKLSKIRAKVWMERQKEGLGKQDSGSKGEDDKQEKKKPKKEKPLGIQKEVDNFVKDFGLESMLPPGFSALSPEAQLMVIRNLKQRIIDIVKTDAETQYSDYLKEKGKTIREKISKFVEKVLPAKTTQLKGLEAEGFENIRDTEEGKKIITDNLMHLTASMEGRKVKMGKDNKPEIEFFDPKDYKNVPQDIVEGFNRAANVLRSMPYEWGQEKRGGKKIKYGKAWENYTNAKDRFIERMDKKDLAAVLQADKVILLDQLINTHPEVEKEFVRLQREASFVKDMGGDVVNLIRRTLGATTTANLLLTGGGYLTRMTVAGMAGSVGVATGIASPIIGGALGSMRGRFRAKDILEERKKGARRGTKDISKEKALTTDASHMARQLNKLVTDIEAVEGKDKARKVAQLEARINHTVKKIDYGLVNFGSPAEIAKNQFELTQALNDAVVLEAMLSKKVEKETEERIESRLARVRTREGNKIEKYQKEFIKKQMIRGAKMGASFAFAGYMLRFIGEQFGWWGDQSSNVPDRPGIPQQPGQPSGVVPPDSNRWQEVQHGSSSIATPSQVSDSIPEPTFRTHVPPPDSGVAEIPTAPSGVPQPEVAQSLESVPVLNEDAIVGKGEGIVTVFRRQIENDAELAKKLGFPGGDENALREFASSKAHELAKDHGYIWNGNEIRVRNVDEVAYQLHVDENGNTKVLERLVDKDGNVTESETREAGEDFDTRHEDYEYIETVKKALKEAYDREHHHHHGHTVPEHQKTEMPEIKTPHELPHYKVPDIHHHGVEEGVGKDWHHHHKDKLEHFEKHGYEHGDHGYKRHGGKLLDPEEAHRVVPPAQPTPDRFPATGQNVIYHSRYGIFPLADPNGPIVSPEQAGGFIAAESVALSVGEVNEIYTNNIIDGIYDELFSGSKDLELARKIVKKTLESPAVEVFSAEDGADQLHSPTLHYLERVQDVLGEDFRPHTGSRWTGRKPETVEEFIKRALKEAGKRGKLKYLIFH